MILLLACLTLWAYWPSAQSQFVFEDHPQTVGLHDASLRLIPRSLAAVTLHAQAGQSAAAYRLGNLGIHVMNGLLAWALSQSLWVLAFVWLHPMWSESVAYPAARADLLLVTATLLTLGWLRLTSTWGAGGGATVGTALALLAKETAVTLPALVLLWLWASHKLSWHWLMYGAGWLVAIVSAGRPYLASLPGWTVPSAVTGWHFAALQAGAFWRLVSLILPIGLTPVHAWEWMPPWLALLALMGVSGLLVCGVLAAKHDARWLAVALLWPLVALLPRFLVPLPNLLTEHHLPYALVGSILAAHAASSGGA